MNESLVYKEHRIHTRQSMSGLWIVCTVSLKKEKVETRHSLTDSVTRVPGEYNLEEKAIQAAKEYIDQEATHLKET